MRLLYTKPELKDLSQGSRIAFARQFRLMTQHEVAEQLGLQGVNKRRIMTRYEKGNRNPKDNRIKEIAKILNVNVNSIKKYDFQSPVDICYMLLWLEEFIPKIQIDISKVPSFNDESIKYIRDFLREWDIIRNKREKKQISYEEYIE